MGYGAYRSSDWAKLKESRSITSSSGVDQVFVQREMDDKFNPRFITFREARDSEDHPDSTPIIIGLDVTGSMGYLAQEIAQNALNETMLKLYSVKPVNDPQLMFAAIGDVGDNAPLQVTQFESDVRIGEQLLGLWLELSGRDAPEDYELIWYFAAKHTKIDCFEKRGKKGVIFTIGDADVHNDMSRQAVKEIFDDTERGMTSAEALRLAKEKYEVFHIHIVKNEATPGNLKALLGGRLLKITRNDVSVIPDIIISVLKLLNGDKLDDVLAGVNEMARPIVKNAIKNVVVNAPGKGIVF